VRYVIDASVAVKWLLPEEYSEQAESLLVESSTFSAPDLLFAEVGNSLWKRVRGRELTQEAGREALLRLLEIEILVTPASLLLDNAFELACEHDRTVYDSIYLALAVEERASFVTGDKRLYNAMHRTSLANRIVWVGSLTVERSDEA
jgi:predicted nucleic acid-binding protein